MFLRRQGNAIGRSIFGHLLVILTGCNTDVPLEENKPSIHPSPHILASTQESTNLVNGRALVRVEGRSKNAALHLHGRKQAWASDLSRLWVRRFGSAVIPRGRPSVTQSCITENRKGRTHMDPVDSITCHAHRIPNPGMTIRQHPRPSNADRTQSAQAYFFRQSLFSRDVRSEQKKRGPCRTRLTDLGLRLGLGLRAQSYGFKEASEWRRRFLQVWKVAIAGEAGSLQENKRRWGNGTQSRNDTHHLLFASEQRTVHSILR